MLVAAHLLVQLSRSASITGHDQHKQCDLRCLFHRVRQMPDAVPTLFVRRLREKERKQAEKEARAVRKAAASGAKNTLDSFINRVTYKVVYAAVWAPALYRGRWTGVELWHGRFPSAASRLRSDTVTLVPCAASYPQGAGSEGCCGSQGYRLRQAAHWRRIATEEAAHAHQAGELQACSARLQSASLRAECRGMSLVSLACKLTQQPVQTISDMGRTMLSTSAGPATPHHGPVCQGSAGRPGSPLAARRGGTAGACSWSGSRAGAAHAAPVRQIRRHGDGVTACGCS